MALKEILFLCIITLVVIYTLYETVFQNSLISKAASLAKVGVGILLMCLIITGNFSVIVDNVGSRVHNMLPGSRVDIFAESGRIVRRSKDLDCGDAVTALKRVGHAAEEIIQTPQRIETTLNKQAIRLANLN